MKSRIFVGTMSSGEGDFHECMKMVQKQTDVEVSHYVIAGLPEKEAHNALWTAWKNARPTHDLFVKLDADTVLNGSTTLFEISKLFQASDRVTAIQAPLWDYMTDGLINGLNCFSTRVIFNDTKSDLYCDRGVDSGHDVVLRQDALPQSLVPAAYHCFHASEIQAFHYGMHRMLKNHGEILAKVRSAWNRNGRDRIRGFALIGAAWCDRFKTGQFNYTDQQFVMTFNEAKETYDSQIARITAS